MPKTTGTADAATILNRHFGAGPAPETSQRRAEMDQIKQDLAIARRQPMAFYERSRIRTLVA